MNNFWSKPFDVWKLSSAVETKSCQCCLSFAYTSFPFHRHWLISPWKALLKISRDSLVHCCEQPSCVARWHSPRGARHQGGHSSWQQDRWSGCCHQKMSKNLSLLTKIRTQGRHAQGSCACVDPGHEEGDGAGQCGRRWVSCSPTVDPSLVE